MNRKASFFAVVSIAAMILTAPLTAVGDSEAPPRDYSKETENGRYFFVMLSPEGWERYDQTEIRKTYSQSGLYKNDGSATPLWVVDWYSYEVYPSSDGRHLIQMGPWASDTDQLAVAFYRDGKRIKAYAIKDLVLDESKLRHTVSHFFWRTSLRYDDKQGILFLKTTDGRSYRFSIKTGEVQAEGGEIENGGESTDKKPRSEGHREERIVLRKPVDVTASIIGLRQPTKDIGGTCDIDLTVRKDTKKFLHHTSLIGVDNADQAFEVIKKGTRWNGKYLLVRTECGGGNAWRCNRDAVFAVKAGKLLPLGQVFAGDRQDLGQSYKNGYFWDIYDKFEMNGLTDHAKAPAFWLALREETGALKADPARTWLRNRPEFKKRMTEIRAITRQTDTNENRRERFEALVLANAILAKYCGRKNDAANLEKIASQYLEPGRLDMFRNILLHVEPGEYPLISEKE